MNFAIVGLGFIHPRHKSAIESVGGKVIVTCDSDPQKGADFLNWREMMKSDIWKEVTHVAICTPNYLHAPMSEAMSDKVVICEKPLTITKESCDKLGDHVNTVLQLRLHPKIIELKQRNLKPKKVKLVIKVNRNRDYWRGWKGDESKSGGVLFNIGVHYFDLLIHLFGEEYTVLHHVSNHRMGYGRIMFGETECEYKVEIFDNSPEQDRSLEIDGEVISLSKADNLSFEDLHKSVYQDVLAGKGIKPKEALKAITLIEQLK